MSTPDTPQLTKQSAEEVFNEVDSLLTLQDSLYIFNLIDSMLSVEPEVKETSQIAIRLAYNSNIASTGRTIGIDKFGLSSGASYFHKKGFYVDVTGYWSKEYEPDYYLTIASVGYMVSPVKWWSLLAEYSRFIYTDSGPDVVIPYLNNIGVTNFFNYKVFVLRADYYFYFGEKNAHRIMPGIGLNLEKRKWHGIDRVLFFPYINILFGTEVITEYFTYAKTRLGALYRLRNGLPLFYSQNKTVFGDMNYSFSAPLSITLNKWNFLVSYTYNIPKALPGEELGLTKSGYLSATVTRYIGFK
ncbi:MAG: hypothetical protein AABY93_06400 [Bacteroidota bacterium]